MDPVELGDDRLLLRLPRPSDVSAVYDACQDPEVQRWTLVPSPYSRRDAEAYVLEHVPRGWADGSWAQFLVTERASGVVLGAMGLHLPEPGLGGVGFWTVPAARRQGVTTRALRLLCRWGFDALRLERIEWEALVGNDGSRRVAEKVGFRVEGLCRRRVLQRGQRADGWIGGLLPEDLD